MQGDYTTMRALASESLALFREAGDRNGALVGRTVSYTDEAGATKGR